MMKIFGTSLNLSKRQKQILAFFLIFSLILGFLLYQKLDSSLVLDSVLSIEERLQDNSINYFFLHFVVLSSLITSSIMIVGLVLFPLYFLWEIVCISFSLFSFYHAFGLLGIIFGLLYNLIIKGVFLVSLFLIFKNIYFIIKHTLFDKNKDSTLLFTKQFQMIFICILVILGYDLLLYLVGNHFLYWLCFIISS